MIEQFQKEYRWLSNFYYLEKPMTRKQEGVELIFSTNEHFYVAMKTMNLDIRKQVCDHPLKGLKRFGNTFPLREDWDEVKLAVMLYGLRYKFSKENLVLRSQLLATGDCEIQEGNYWNDKFWGVCLKTGKGENNLGKLLMQVRGEISNEPKE